MKEYYSEKQFTLFQGDMREMAECIPAESIDSIVTDPPYGLTSIVDRFGKEGSFSKLSRGFMGQAWDGSGVEYNIDTWRRCYEVLKPGGYLLAFGGSRTFHRIACAIEDAGFEIRDTIMWLYGSGFPKSMNIGLALDKKNGAQGQRGTGGFRIAGNGNAPGNSKYMGKNETPMPAYTEYKTDDALKWGGWGTALKPAYEPIIVARKPFRGSLVDNILVNGVGGINIDECRVPFENGEKNGSIARYESTPQKGNNGWEHKNRGANINEYTIESMEKGRFPANLILTYDETDREEVCGGMPDTKGNDNIRHNKSKSEGYVGYRNYSACESTGYDDSGSAARYFYCAKASKKDRDEGLSELEYKVLAYSNQAQAEVKRGNLENDRKGMNKPLIRKNNHPTVKPTSLMQYLVRLVTPAGGTVLDPFNGGGTTGKAVMWENRERGKNYKYIGIELDKNYLEISKARIEYAAGAEQREEQKKPQKGEQISLEEWQAEKDGTDDKEE